MKRIIYPCLMLLMACTHSEVQSGLVYYNDFESVKGWTDINLDNKHAHSGVFSNKLDSIHIFGLTFKQLFKEISTEKIGRVKISMWAFMTPDSKGAMVLEVRHHDGHQVFWVSKQLNGPTVTPNTWQQISAEFGVRNDLVNNPENTVLAYAWNAGKKDFYVDDIRIEFVLGNR